LVGIVRLRTQATEFSFLVLFRQISCFSGLKHDIRNYYYISEIKASDEKQFLLLLKGEGYLSVRNSGLEMRGEKVSILKPIEYRQYLHWQIISDRYTTLYKIQTVNKIHLAVINRFLELIKNIVYFK
jgi:hypothetical protein